MPYILSGIILLINEMRNNNNLLLVLSIVQIVLLFAVSNIGKFSLFIRLFVDLAYYLSIDMPIIVILVESFRRLITGKNTGVEN